MILPTERLSKLPPRRPSRDPRPRDMPQAIPASNLVCDDKHDDSDEADLDKACQWWNIIHGDQQAHDEHYPANERTKPPKSESRKRGIHQGRKGKESSGGNSGLKMKCAILPTRSSLNTPEPHGPSRIGASLRLTWFGGWTGSKLAWNMGDRLGGSQLPRLAGAHGQGPNY